MNPLALTAGISILLTRQPTLTYITYIRISGFYLCARSYDHLGMALAWRSGGTVEVTGQSKSIEVDSFYSNLRHRHVQMRCNFYPTAEVKGIRSIM